MDSVTHDRASLLPDAPWLQPDSFLSRFHCLESTLLLPRLAPVTNTTQHNLKFINTLFTPTLFHFS